MPSTKHAIVSEDEDEAPATRKRSRTISTRPTRGGGDEQRNSGRPRVPSTRQKEIGIIFPALTSYRSPDFDDSQDRNEVNSLAVENEKLQRQLANLRKKTQRETKEDDSPDPESEEEMHPVTSSIERLYSVRLQPSRKIPILRRGTSSSQPPIRATVNTPQRIEPASSEPDEETEKIPTGNTVISSSRRAPLILTPTPKPAQQPETLPPPCQKSTNSKPSKRRAKDFAGLTHLIALRGAKEMEARINTRDPFPDPTGLTAAAIRCLENAKLHIDKKHEVVEVEAPLLVNSFKARQSRARQIPLNVVRTQVVVQYGFRDSVKKRQVNKNLANSLLQEERYAHKDMAELIGYLEHPIFSDVYKKAYFPSDEGLGLLFPRLFDNGGKGTPFPVATLALIKLQVEFCIEEWKDGILDKKAFDVKKRDLKVRYQRHLKKVEDWIDTAPAFTANVRKKWHDRAIRDFVTETAPERPSRSAETIKRSLAAIEARTGDTDSEADELSSENDDNHHEANMEEQDALQDGETQDAGSNKENVNEEG
ncbi:hypothetical protein V5O48_006806 [Marasmius crinis-equi]|uniref:DUF6532 domain-containing protein n=1 Tax=Marasmius crinis-equi TaxID=585013 RepID=A0ABR3FIG7_9AGAR